MRFRTIFLCVSIKYFFAFLAHFVIDALRFRNTASAIGPASYVVNDNDLTATIAGNLLCKYKLMIHI